MKKQVLVVLALTTMVLMFSGSAPALADARGHGSIIGAVYLPVPQWGDLRIWLDFNVHEVDPSTHAATGRVLAQLYSPTDGWKRLDLRPECVAFGADSEGKQTAVIVVEILDKQGWGQGEKGEHGRWRVRDGGTPGNRGDQWMIESYNYADWIEYWPKDVPAPDCESFTPDEPPIDARSGNLVIHH